MSEASVTSNQGVRSEDARSPDLSPGINRNGNKTEDNNDTDTPQKNMDGGRLQFFLDGKMVLELTDRQEGGKSWWVPVTQKTYWPPPPPSCSTPSSTVRQESSASYSVSDDSSVQSQSSPWQRESRFKNPNPHRVSSSEGITFHVKRRERCRCHWIRRRRPFRSYGNLCTFSCNPACNECQVKWQRMTKRQSVIWITSRLMEKALKKKLLTAATDSPSPRKRLLRDMEKVRLNEASSSWSSLKKAKAVVPPTSLPTYSALPSHALQPTKVYDRQSSYSIDSLLNKERQDASNSSFLRSLLRKTPAHVTINGTVSKSNGLTYSQPRLPVSFTQASELVQVSALQAVLGTRAPLWLPFNVASLNPFIPPPVPISLAARPGPSSQIETISQQPRDEEDEVPLNLTTSRGRES